MTFSSVKILADTKFYDGTELQRVTTFKLKFPRIILTHLLTHRVFSRNTASSRAIPILKMIKYVWKEPFVPDYWGANQSGMEAETEVTPIRKFFCTMVWLYLFRPSAILMALFLHFMGVHKQIGSRLLEPFYYCEMILTASELSNFFKLRCDRKAQPETRELANLMRVKYKNNRPKKNSIHIPFLDEIDLMGDMELTDKLIISTALCAKVSYRNEETTLEKSKVLLNKLLGDGVIQHLSPFEHICFLETKNNKAVTKGNLKGWVQLRHSGNLRKLLNL